MIKARILLFAALLAVSSSLMAQSGNAKLIDWKFLAKVKFEDKYYPEYEAWYLYPVFPEEIKALDGKQVIIKGYMIPMDVEDGMFALSAYPFSNCFFCGGAGPESVMTIKFKGSHRKYKTDDVVTMVGTLKLNNSNLEEFNYVLENATEVK